MIYIKPFTIKTFFPKGNPSGLRVAFIRGQPIKAFYIPRQYLNDFVSYYSKYSSLNGVYMLFNPSTKNKEVYIGKTTNILRRMRNHTKQNDPEDQWSIEIVFTINDSMDPMGDCAISYLEYLMCRKVRASTTYNLFQDMEEDRGQSPQMPNISRSDKVCFDGLFNNINILSKSLGFDVFLNVTSGSQNSKNVFHVARNHHPYGSVRYIDNRIFVLKGSTIYNRQSIKFKKSRNGRIYSKWVNDGSIKDNVFQRDKECGSLSEASSIILKLSSSNGWTELHRNGDNKSLNKIYR